MVEDGMEIPATLEGNELYREFMDKLASANLDQHVNLPMFAVMGDTSSGKSSLLSAIAEIELPSSDKLTTRCPILLQMKACTERMATVSVTWKDPPVHKSASEITFPPRSVDDVSWNDLTGHIAAAQEHIVKVSGKEVARDVVSVKLAGPRCEDLTLIDLPGIVRSTGKGESETLSQEIQALINAYLDNSRCVILAVHPANVDFHNSQIMADAKKVDPNTRRTLPVLTKPDLIDHGAENGVKELLLGEMTEGFERGFHMVKGRGQASLNKNESIAKGLSDEDIFFRTVSPWKDIEDKQLFGIPQLRRKLGSLQVEIIRKTLPQIISEMKEQRDKTAAALNALGASFCTLAEKRAFFFQIRDQLLNAAQRILLGGNSRVAEPQLSGFESEKLCSALLHEECEHFNNAIRKTRLSQITSFHVGMTVIAVIGQQEVQGKIVGIDGDNVYLDSHHGQRCTPTAPIYVSDAASGTVTDSTGRYYFRRATHYRVLQSIAARKVRRDPQWLIELIRNRRPNTLSIFVDRNVFHGLVASYIRQDWRKPCLDLVDATIRLLKKHVKEVLQDLVIISNYPRLRDFLARRIDFIIDKTENDVRDKVETFIRQEQSPYTQDHYLNETISRLRSQPLRDALVEALGLDGELDNNQRTLSSIKSTIDAVFERNQKKSIDSHRRYATRARRLRQGRAKTVH